MNQILALWATPRSTSTAFEWMMRQRGDLRCFHEPFGEAWYQGETPLWPRVQADSLRTPGLSLASVWESLKASAAVEAVFIKDFPHYVETIWSDAFLDHFNHSFLIRDPAKTLSSMAKHWPEFTLSEAGFVEQHALFGRLCDRLGEAPPVLDSDDLLEDPQSMVRIWCEAVGIPFIPDALRWDPGPRDEVSWWDGGSFHENLRGSDGLKPQPRRHADISEASDTVKAMYDACLPHYEHLHAHRLTP